ncbi:MAG: ScpA family protein [Chloroflexota bacterium]
MTPTTHEGRSDAGARPTPTAALPRLGPGGLALSVAAGAHPERATHIRTEGFEGPLGLLLALIEERRLDILTVPLGELAAAYLDAIATMDEGQLPHISAFVSVASQLILNTSRALLPREPRPVADGDEGVDPEEALRARLLEYRRYRDAAAALTSLAATGAAPSIGSRAWRSPPASAGAGRADATPAWTLGRLSGPSGAGSRSHCRWRRSRQP